MARTNASFRAIGLTDRRYVTFVTGWRPRRQGGSGVVCSFCVLSGPPYAETANDSRPPPKTKPAWPRFRETMPGEKSRGRESPESLLNRRSGRGENRLERRHGGVVVENSALRVGRKRPGAGRVERQRNGRRVVVAPRGRAAGRRRRNRRVAGAGRHRHREP